MKGRCDMDDIEVTDEMMDALVENDTGWNKDKAIRAAIAVSPLYKRVQELEDELAKRQWWSIETLPKHYGTYIVWHPHYGVDNLWFQVDDGGRDGRKAGNWYNDNDNDDYDDPRNYQVTHWMPLPEPPNVGVTK